MNGQNKKRLNNSKFSVLAVTYIIVMLFLGMVVFFLPEIYNKIDEKRINTITIDIKESVEVTDSATRTKRLKEISEMNQIDVVVLSQSGYVFQTLPSIEFKELDKIVKKVPLSYHASYVITVEGTDYQVWLAIYTVNPQKFFEVTLIGLVILILILFTVIMLLLLKMFYDTVRPLKRLKNTIIKMKKFDLAGVSSSENLSKYDGLLEDLTEFTGDLQGKMDNFGMRYTELEKELQAKREAMIYKDQLVASVIHDLKTPLTMQSMQFENLIEQHQDDLELIAVLKRMQEKNHKTLKEIQSAIYLVHKNDVKVEPVKVDIIKVIQETLQRFKPILQSRKIYAELDFPKRAMIKIDEIEAKQLIHNILSNVAQYTKENGMFELKIEERSNEMIISAYNESDDAEMIDFDHVFELFYHTALEVNQYSTGIGMYTVRVMVEKYGGKYYFEPKNEGVLLKIILPKEVDNA
ncbi:hypothetical protein IGL98_003347 [Enterococcus sp. DIV0840]|uniref:sensor histidine kinase n=1 Tax=unclassified Enterococcus TaxID=2608891 RepID=UPI001A8D8CC6|nr:HAMP domain-containing sensor histidine kinase [Enterococcus sp. DIV0849a]MBO0433094.1 HAMP domain-containing histidine kinase [Enterococcus sp. DIV0849a]